MKILAFSGKKQSGKNALGEFLQRNAAELFPGQRVIQASWADSLKRLCCDLFGVEERQAYGDDAAKNEPTIVSWDSFPLCELPNDKPSRPMTVRELLQYVGTEFGRRLNPDCWVQATIRHLEREAPDLALITDTRFPNEVAAAQRHGKVVRLTRAPFGANDTHASEIALDEPAFPVGGFDAVLDNKAMSVAEQNTAMVRLLQHWGWVRETM